jgi:hypothetical protein
MKKVFLGLVILLPFYSFSQTVDTPVKPNTKIEKMLKEEGLVLKKDFYDVIKIGTTFDYVDFNKLIVTDLKTKTQTKGIYMSGYKSGTSSSLSQSGSCYIDDNKVLGLIEFLELANEKYKIKEPNQVEYNFNLDNLRVTLFNSKNNLNKMFIGKAEEEFNYWYLTFEIGIIRSADIRLQNLEDINLIITKLKEVDFK